MLTKGKKKEGKEWETRKWMEEQKEKRREEGGDGREGGKGTERRKWRRKGRMEMDDGIGMHE